MHSLDLYQLDPSNAPPVKHEFVFPGKWLEAEPAHLLSIARAQLADQEPARIKFDLLKQLASIPALLMEGISAADVSFEVDTTDYKTNFRPVPTSEYRLLPQLDWAFTPGTYRNSLLPTLEHNGTTWNGPQNGFDHMPLMQWIWCTELGTKFREQTEPQKALLALHDLLGALYQPVQNTWSAEPIEQYGQELGTLPPEVQLAAVLNFEALHADLRTRYDRVFRPDPEANGVDPSGLFGVAYDLATTGAFGDHAKAEVQPLHLVLAYMEHNLYADEQAAQRAERAAADAKSA